MYVVVKDDKAVIQNEAVTRRWFRGMKRLSGLAAQTSKKRFMDFAVHSVKSDLI